MAVSKNAVLSSKGQLTIPVDVRTALRLHQGDTVSFEVTGDGSAIMRPVAKRSPFSDYAGRLSKGTGRSAKEIVEELREARGW